MSWRDNLPKPICGKEKFWAAVIQVTPPTLAIFGVMTAEQAVALQVAMAPLTVYLTGNSGQHSREDVLETIEGIRRDYYPRDSGPVLEN